ncbi:hypothetical protein HWB52_gp58 [Pseudomonas phage Littlefix]|uniref:Uncharacterized protein n=1 Tax=Pseudomonas phage Littlefix TaxID=2079289 RepID=A0A2K9VHP9_9CAUD|nr:hypothetical protein HWB52_gp58 [Pseudomonas phage Littlefix]AUV61873.1 hypothetical protein PsPhLittlefix_gp58 [Pseudomonas phage Littlefix]
MNIKPVVSISLSAPKVIDHDFFVFTSQVRYKESNQYWLVKCIFTSFEGARRLKEFHSMYKAKALYEAYEWLKEQKGLDDKIQRELKKKKDHRSSSYMTKMRLRQTVIKSTMGDKRYRLTYRDVSDENALYFGYGDTPQEAYMALVDAMSAVYNKPPRRRNEHGVVIGLTPTNDTTKYRQHWWQFWRPKL